METKKYNEMIENLNKAYEELDLRSMDIFLFGYCDATQTLTDVLLDRKIKVRAILDNSETKQGIQYKGISVVLPNELLTQECSGNNNSIVFLTSRFSESMQSQLRTMGYNGTIRKLINYNSYSDYSLSEDTISRMRDRVENGKKLLSSLKIVYPESFIIFCPFDALGDVYLMSAFFSAFAKKRNICKVTFCVLNKALADVIHLFGEYDVEVIEQEKLDAMIQAALYTDDQNTYIAHQDRPYVVNLHKALYIKKIPLETIYCCGVFGLPKDTPLSVPGLWQEYPYLGKITNGKTAILSPYAKSVPALPRQLWTEIVADLNDRGYEVYTNVVGEEEPLEGTMSISPRINEMKSVVEKAGLFIGIRSGLCDVIRTAKCRKIALYPDYCYCDTKWKAIEMYSIDEFENILVEDRYKWKLN